MKPSLFIMPLKEGKVEAYKVFLNECVERGDEYRDMLQRYHLNNVKVWLSKFHGKYYVFVMHEADDDFAEKLAQWSASTHPFDQWFNQHLLDCYDFEAVEDSEPLPLLAAFE